jgi:hypothetical protein
MKVWRELNENSIQAAVERLNKDLDLGGPHKRSYLSVSEIIESYLRHMLETVRHHMYSERYNTNLVRSVSYFMDRFDLNETEARYVKARMYTIDEDMK